MRKPTNRLTLGGLMHGSALTTRFLKLAKALISSSSWLASRSLLAFPLEFFEIRAWPAAFCEACLVLAEVEACVEHFEVL
jgi:hypothetical protein